MTTNVEQEMAFYSLLAAATRSVEIPESADVYGWLCGSWDLEVEVTGGTIPLGTVGYAGGETIARLADIFSRPVEKGQGRA